MCERLVAIVIGEMDIIIKIVTYFKVHVEHFGERLPELGGCEQRLDDDYSPLFGVHQHVSETTTSKIC